jgi:hypothetical protein
MDRTVKEQLRTFEDLLNDPDRPTHVKEIIVPGEPIHIGACDAAKEGMRGVWFTHDHRAILLRARFPTSVP